MFRIAELIRSGGSYKKGAKDGGKGNAYTTTPVERIRRSNQATELAETNRHFDILLSRKPTSRLPAACYTARTNRTLYRSSAEANFADFMNAQTLETHLRYTEPLEEDLSIPTITWLGTNTAWLPDFDVTLNDKSYFVEVKGASNHVSPSA
jgi:hypothetical protein